MEELREWFACESDEEPCFDEMKNREFQPEYGKSNKVCTIDELTQHLESLKKDELIYKVKIAACKEILSKKLEEIKQAELQLNEKHEVIWKNREEFCLEADQFISNFGPFSEWWETQLNYISDLENLKQKQVEEAKSKEEIGIIQTEIEKLEEELEKKSPTQTVAEVEVHATEDGSTGLKSKNENIQKIVRSEGKIKKVRFLDEPEDEDEIKENISASSPPEDDGFSLVDVNIVKMVKRIRNKQIRKLRSKRFKQFIQNNFVIH